MLQVTPVKPVKPVYQNHLEKSITKNWYKSSFGFSIKGETVRSGYVTGGPNKKHEA